VAVASPGGVAGTVALIVPRGAVRTIVPVALTITVTRSGGVTRVVPLIVPRRVVRAVAPVALAIAITARGGRVAVPVPLAVAPCAGGVVVPVALAVAPAAARGAVITAAGREPGHDAHPQSSKSTVHGDKHGFRLSFFVSASLLRGKTCHRM